MMPVRRGPDCSIDTLHNVRNLEPTIVLACRSLRRFWAAKAAHEFEALGHLVSPVNELRAAETCRAKDICGRSGGTVTDESG